MAQKKRVAKKRIKEDRLVTLTVEASQFVQRYFTQVVAGVVVLIVAVGAILLLAHVKRTAARESQQEFALAISQYNAGELGAAVEGFGRIVDKYGNHSAGELSRYFLGKALLAQGKYEEALRAFDAYIEKSPEDAPFRAAAVIGKATCLEGLHNFSAAAELLEGLSQRLDAADPRYAEVLFAAAQDYERTGSRERALDYYRKVADKATGLLRDRALVAAATLE